MAVQPNFPRVNKEAYRCASCYTMSQSYHSDPLQYCWSICQSVRDTTRQCIRDQAQANPLALPDHMSCVQSQQPQALSVSSVAPSQLPPREQCLTQCLAHTDTCVNTCRA